MNERDTYEFRTGADGVGVERREVREVVIKETVGDYPTAREFGTLSGILTFVWNGRTQIKSLSGGKKFYCSDEAINRLEIPGNGGEVVRTWVYYGPWASFTGFDP